jgi:hypothetical protein
VKSTIGTFSGKASSNTFYRGGVESDEDNNNVDSDSNEELLKRKRAWAELEREQDEVKRNIKSILKTAPESRVMDDPILADRVRGVRYDPQKYDHESRVHHEDKRSNSLKEQMKKEEAGQKKVDTTQQLISSSSMSNQSQKRQWTADSATQKPAATNAN